VSLRDEVRQQNQYFEFRSGGQGLALVDPAKPKGLPISANKILVNRDGVKRFFYLWDWDQCSPNLVTVNRSTRTGAPGVIPAFR
jgi:hypothetical protein